MSGYRSLHRQQLLTVSTSIHDENDTNATDDSVLSSSSTSSSPSVVIPCPIWHVTTTPSLSKQNKSGIVHNSLSSLDDKMNCWRIWIASADGLVRTYLVKEKSLELLSHQGNEDVLDASTMQLVGTHLFVGREQQQQQRPSQSPSTQAEKPIQTKSMQPKLQSTTTTTSSCSTVLGCTRVCLVRNYVGDDDNAGVWLIASMGMTGRIRIWQWEDEDTTTSAAATKNDWTIQSTIQEFVLPSSTGTTLVWCPPQLFGHGPLLLATACLDGSIALIASGCSTPTAPNCRSSTTSATTISEGTIVATIGAGNTSTTAAATTTTTATTTLSMAMSLVFSPVQKILAVGRQDGSVDLFDWSNHTTRGIRASSTSLSSSSSSSPASHIILQQRPRQVRLSPQHVITSPIRAMAFSTDGELIMIGSDQGMIGIWNVNTTTLNSKDEQQHLSPEEDMVKHKPSSSLFPTTKVVSPRLVHHVLQAHSSWILDIVAIDQRRFVSCGMDQKLHVWNIGQIYQPIHTFSTDQIVWTTSILSSLMFAQSPLSYRLVTGSEEGWVQVYHMDGKA